VSKEELLLIPVTAVQRLWATLRYAILPRTFQFPSGELGVLSGREATGHSKIPISLACKLKIGFVLPEHSRFLS
jgi:hypothetical protein